MPDEGGGESPNNWEAAPPLQVGLHEDDAICGVVDGPKVPLDRGVPSDTTKAEHSAITAALAVAIRRERARQGLSQEELAARVGIAARHLQKIEAAEVNLTLRTLAKLADAVGVSAADLIRTAPSDSGAHE